MLYKQPQFTLPHPLSLIHIHIYMRGARHHEAKLDFMTNFMHVLHSLASRSLDKRCHWLIDSYYFVFGRLTSNDRTA